MLRDSNRILEVYEFFLKIYTFWFCILSKNDLCDTNIQYVNIIYYVEFKYYRLFLLEKGFLSENDFLHVRSLQPVSSREASFTIKN